MKVCFIGLGSIGKRHLKNLIDLSKQYNLQLEVHAFRKAHRPLERDIEELVDHQIFCEEDLNCDYDIVFITNPTNLHYDTIKLMENKTKNMFIEKPIFDNQEYSVNDLKFNDNGIYYVAGPLKYSLVIQKLKEILQNERVYNIRAICSSYLPDWRPNVDYRNIYSAKKIEGGGASIDLIHEWDYITYLFGFPAKAFNLKGQYSHLEIDSDDISIYIGKYEDKLVEIHLDYFGRRSRREIELFTESGTIIGDFINKRIYFSDGRETINFIEGNNDMYVKELKNFIDMVLNASKGENNTKHAYNLLKLAMGDSGI